MKRFSILFLIFFITCGNTNEVMTPETSTTTTTSLVAESNDNISLTTTTNVCESYNSEDEKKNCYQSQQSKKFQITGEELIVACENAKEYIYLSFFYDYYSSNAVVIELKTIELLDSINDDPNGFGITDTETKIANELIQIYQNFESGWYGRGSNPIDVDYVNQFYDADYFDVGLGLNPDYENGNFAGLKELRILHEKAWLVSSDTFSALNQREGVGNLVLRKDSKGFAAEALLFARFIINEYSDIYYESNPDLSHLNLLYENYLKGKEDFLLISNQIDNYNCSNLSSYTP